MAASTPAVALPDTMRAVRISKFGGPEKATLQTVPVPAASALAPHELLVHVHAASVNPLDFKVRSGELGKIVSMSTPMTLGHDFAGVVAAVGSECAFAIGDEVYGCAPLCSAGTLADYFVASDAWTAVKPANLTHVQASSLALVGLTALQGMRDLTEGQTVLITGIGGVGAIAVQIATRALRATAIVLASPSKMARATELGATRVVDYTVAGAAAELTGLDLVLAGVGKGASYLDHVKAGGAVVALSDPPTGDVMRTHPILSAKKKFYAPLVLDMMSKSTRSAATKKGVRYESLYMIPSRADLDRLSALTQDGSLVAVVAETFPLERFAEAFAVLEAGKVVGKVVVQLR